MRINKFKFRHIYRYSKSTSDKVNLNKREFTPASDSGLELNEHGYIRNSISTLLRTQNTLSFERALKNFVEINAKSPFKDMTPDEQFEALRPRWCQLPSQRLQFENWLMDKRISALEDYKAEQEAIEAEEQARIAASAAATTE